MLQGLRQHAQTLLGVSTAIMSCVAEYGQQDIDTGLPRIDQLPQVPIGAIIAEPGADTGIGMVSQGRAAIAMCDTGLWRCLAWVCLIIVIVPSQYHGR